MNAPIRELPQIARPAQIGAEEWALRLELAACYRLFDAPRLDRDDLQPHHAARARARAHFLINPYGLHYSEVTARNLVKVDVHGQVDRRVEPAGQPGRLRHPQRRSTSTAPTRTA